MIDTDKRAIIKKMSEIAGWYGMLAIIGAYAFVSFKLLESSSLAYQLLNLTGALGLMFISLIKNVKQNIILNLFWAIIAVVAISGLILE